MNKAVNTTNKKPEPIQIDIAKPIFQFMNKSRFSFKCIIIGIIFLQKPDNLGSNTPSDHTIQYHV